MILSSISPSRTHTKRGGAHHTQGQKLNTDRFTQAQNTEHTPCLHARAHAQANAHTHTIKQTQPLLTSPHPPRAEGAPESARALAGRT